ncbi:hypothetical protein H4F05_07990 [Vibrio cholerae]
MSKDFFEELDKAPTSWLFHYDSRMVNERLYKATSTGDKSSIREFISERVVEQRNDIFTFPLLSDVFVQFLCSMADKYGRWYRENGDEYSAPEMRIRRISQGLEDVIGIIIEKHINPILSILYMDSYEIGWIEPPFIIRYEESTQKEMGLHFDGQSELTLSVPLSDKFKGGGLYFPRQNYSTSNVPVGHVIIFPGGPSHIHKAVSIENGERYSLTIWSSSEEPN